MRHRTFQAALAALLLAFPVLTVAGATSAADIALVASGANLLQTGERMWTLEKSGSLSGDTVTWEITATETATTPGELVVEAALALTNIGSGPATIGNIVVNLQKRVGNKWVTASSDIANATHGDAATTAVIHRAASSENKTTWSENSASGSLNFMDATNNTVFSLVPQQMIGAGQTRTLLFSASFDNNDAALNLTAGTQIRAEVIVTFGNATQSGNSTANLDINGNGSLDADESRVRSVPSRLTLTVPAAVTNVTPTLSDTISDIVATGSVTVSNVSINLGATSGTVSAAVNGGATGGTITNCAHLTSPDQTVNTGGSMFTIVNGLDLQACSAIDVGAVQTCTIAGSPGCPWQAGDAFTRTQLAWDSTTSWYTAYDTIYASTFGTIEVGIPGTSGFSLRFTTPTRVSNFFVQTLAPGTLNADLVDTTGSSSGQFGGETLALRMNVDFSAVGALGGEIDFGALRLCTMSDATLDNRTVSEVLAIANTLLGGGSSTYSVTAINDLAAALNRAFLDGAPSAFAAAHLVNGNCP